MSRKEIKIEKEKKFKREYISVFFAIIILLAFIAAIVLVIMYEPKEQPTEETKVNTVTVEDVESDGYLESCESELIKKLKEVANGISVEYYPVKILDELDTTNPEDAISWDGDTDFYITEVEIKVKGLTDDVYLKIKNTINMDVINVGPEDYKNGEYTFFSPDIAKRITFIIEIVSNKGECLNQIVRKVSFNTKVYNIYSDTSACIMYPNYSKCNQMINEELSYDEFHTGLKKYIEKNPGIEKEGQKNIIKAVVAEEQKRKENNNTITEKEKEQIKKNKFVEKIKKEKQIIITVISIIGVGVIAVIILAAIRRRK